MATLGTLPRARALGLRALLSGLPEVPAASAIALAWVALLLTDARGSPFGGSSSSAAIPDMSGMPGMTDPNSAGLLPALSRMASQMPHWLLMSVAMMGPVGLAGIRHTGLNSFRWRRQRAMAEFALGYLAVWVLFGSLAITAEALIPGGPGLPQLSLVLAAAAAWQLSPFKRRFLRDCHRGVPLPLRGWRAERGALVFGLRNGISCLGTCWCMMLVMVVAPAGHLLWMVALGALVTVEGLAQRPRRVTRLAAAGLAVATLATVAVALG
jgi:predicted metal-binding membrane protein